MGQRIDGRWQAGPDESGHAARRASIQSAGERRRAVVHVGDHELLEAIAARIKNVSHSLLRQRNVRDERDSWAALLEQSHWIEVGPRESRESRESLQIEHGNMDHMAVAGTE